MIGLVHLTRPKEDIARMAVEHVDAWIAELNKPKDAAPPRGSRAPTMRLARTYYKVER